MISSFVGWIISSSSSSSQYQGEEEEEEDDTLCNSILIEPRERVDIPIDDAEINDDVVVVDGDPIPVGIAVADGSIAVTVAVPSNVGPIGDHPPITTTSTVIGHRKRRRNDGDSNVLDAKEEERKSLEEARRMFHRVWTKEDEMELLQGFLDYTTRRGVTHCNDTTLFYDQIRSKLRAGFNKSQLLEKLRRLKKKYRNVLDKMGSDNDFSFRSAHDEATFEISRKIWGDSMRVGRPGLEDNTLVEDHEPSPNPDNLNLVTVKVESDEAFGYSRPTKRMNSRVDLWSNEKHDYDGSTSNHNNDNIDDSNVSDLIEETLRSCMSPLLKELLSNPAPLCLGGVSAMNLEKEEVVDKQWREQRIYELEVYSKRLEVVQNQIMGALEELRSIGG